MKQGYKNDDLLVLAKPDGLKVLYGKYADKLLGYILAIVNDRQMAEEHVVKIFAAISASKNSFNLTGYANTWDWLTMLAQTEIGKFKKASDECKSVIDNTTYILSHQYLSRMNEVQRKVFCAVYYHRKSLTELVKELDLSEQTLRFNLREAFMIIRNVKDEN